MDLTRGWGNGIPHVAGQLSSHAATKTLTQPKINKCFLKNPLGVSIAAWKQRCSLPEAHPSLFGSVHSPHCLLGTKARVTCNLSICFCYCFSYSRGIFCWFHISTKSGKKKNRWRRLHELSDSRPAALIYVTHVATGTSDFYISDTMHLYLWVWSRKQDHYEWHEVKGLLCNWSW